MQLKISSTLKMSDGKKIPVLGLGTWQMQDNAAEKAVEAALRAGYRLIDTAAVYGNEREVGSAIKRSGVPREDIFLTTKIWNDSHDDPRAALEASLKKLGTDYVDLYLIHWPVEQRLSTWKAFEKLKAEGKCVSVGVSNFTIKHLNQIETPAVNQVEFSPFLYQKELLEFCKKNSIIMEAYSPLSRAKKLSDNRLAEIAARYSKSPAQMMLRWALQHEIVAIPKSSNEKRIAENADIFNFSISSEDMEKLDALNENYRTCWDPSSMP